MQASNDIMTREQQQDGGPSDFTHILTHSYQLLHLSAPQAVQDGGVS